MDLSNGRTIEASTLSRQLSWDGMLVDVLIYRSMDAPDWLLEIEDHSGNSAFWAGFSTETEALAKAISVIETEKPDLHIQPQPGKTGAD